MICRPRKAGSSPLTRGKLTSRRKNDQFPGLIPAHAGKTLNRSSGELHVWAHPRSRGENRAWRWGVRNGRGSSPLTRGKPPRDVSPARAERLIPAHAGKTPRPHLRHNVKGAHPRSRGENSLTTRRVICQRGSSPLTRGKPTCLQADSHTFGLIPAHAGKTDTPRTLATASRAHPRSRGENVRRRNGAPPQ